LQWRFDKGDEETAAEKAREKELRKAGKLPKRKDDDDGESVRVA
jgi:hypothetical protein